MKMAEQNNNIHLHIGAEEKGRRGKQEDSRLYNRHHCIMLENVGQSNDGCFVVFKFYDNKLFPGLRSGDGIGEYK